LSTPFFVYYGTVQYADILVAYFMLAGGYYYLNMARGPAPTCDAVLFGMCLGFMCFAKDNGIAAAALMAAGCAPAFWKHARLRPGALAGFAGVAAAAFVTKYWSTLSIVNHAYETDWRQALDLQRWGTIISSVRLIKLSSGGHDLEWMVLFFSIVYNCVRGN